MGANDDMLELFRAEAAAHGARLSEALAHLDQHPGDRAVLEACAKTAHQLRSAARLANVTSAADLGDGLERVFHGALQAGALADGGTDRLQPVVDLLAEIAAAADAAPDPEALHTALQGLAALQTATRAPEAAAPCTGGGDPSLLALFRDEVDGQAQTLTAGLLTLERAPDTDALTTLMRAAHSIKGAARMVGVDAAVTLAHAMEDCFVAAQEGRVALQDAEVDLLLRATDALKAVAAGEPGDTDTLCAALQEVLSGKSAPAALPQPAATATGASAPGVHGQRAVRVSAERIDRLVALAGELKVAHGWVRHYTGSMLTLKRHQNELAAVIDRLRAVLDPGTLSDLGDTLLDEAQRLASRCRNDLAERIARLEEFDRRSANLSGRLNHEVIASRMRPFRDGVQGFPRMVRDLARSLSKKVELIVRGLDTQVDREILEKLNAPLNHLLRNAVDHGIETPAERVARGKPEGGTIIVEAGHTAGRLRITVSDNGRGVDLQSLRQRVVDKRLVNDTMAAELSEAELLEFLFLPAFSTRDRISELSGRGVGLDVVYSAVQEMRGQVGAMTKSGEGLRVQLELPLTLSVMRTLTVEIAGELYAFPLARIDNLVRVGRDAVTTLEDRQFITTDDGRHVSVVEAAQLLERPGGGCGAAVLPLVLLGGRSQSCGVVVDRIVGERELAVQPLDPRLGKIQDVAAAAIDDDGTPVLILDVDDLLRTVAKLGSDRNLGKLRTQDPSGPRRKRILVADDSLTVREVERKLLESRGYAVDVALDGMEAWNSVRVGAYDLVITDVDMPRMNGVELAALIKKDARLKHLPVMVVSYKDRPEDRERGMDAGADYYLAKDSFHDDTLLEAVLDLIGEAT